LSGAPALAQNASQPPAAQPQMAPAIAQQDNNGHYWDGGRWRDHDWWKAHYDWRDNHWRPHDEHRDRDNHHDRHDDRHDDHRPGPDWKHH